LPQGYLFQYGDLTQSFYEYSLNLAINELSVIVEEVDGYHIIYRIPINFDTIPFSNIIEEDFRTLRMLVAFSMFGDFMEDWHNRLNPEFMYELESIDISVLFKDA